MKKELKIYGTLGPSCNDKETLKKMFDLGMSGMRINLSHMSLNNASEWINNLHQVKSDCELLIDMQGPELRIGNMESTMIENEIVLEDVIPISQNILDVLKVNQDILLDDGKISLTVIEKDKKTKCKVNRSGILSSFKSIALPNIIIDSPTLTKQDIENLKQAKEYGVTGIMQPFVRNKQDLMNVKTILKELDLDLRIFAKIENQLGVDSLEELIPFLDEVIIARGDLANAVGLIQLPKAQHRIQDICHKHQVPYMVVTQMLDSMIHRAVPTRAEVTDIYEAVHQGAHSIMLTGETASGKYPVEAMYYFIEVAKTAL